MNQMPLKQGLLLMISLFLLTGTGCISDMKKKEIHIAVAGPGDNTPIGKMINRSIRDYVDQKNKEGGFGSYKIILDFYDDQNDQKIARQQAKKIADSNAVAVIGHLYSSASISAGEVYQQRGIPAITYGSTHLDVTQNRDHYFRIVPNDALQGKFLARYVNQALKAEKVSIIYEEDPYGTYLKNIFQKTYEESGNKIT